MLTARIVAVVPLAVVVSVLVSAVNAAAQDPAAIEASLALDGRTRGLIQQGLQNEGFDPGIPDGVFGPRTRAAIRTWQAAREFADTGYLDQAQTDALRAAAALTAAATAEVPQIPPPVAATSGLVGTDAGTVDFGDDASVWALDGECDDPRFSGEGVAQTQVDWDTYHDATDCRALFNMGRIRLRDAPAPGTVASHVEHGQLDAEDETLVSGEFIDLYVLEGCAGDKAVIELRSEEFDPYLIVRTPSDGQLYNDDHEGDPTRSLLALKLDQTAGYVIGITTSRVGEAGEYTFSLSRAEPRRGLSATGVEEADRSGSPPPQPGELRVFDGIEFVWIPPGEFRMGSMSPEARDWEQPLTQVRISRGLWLGKYEVTQADWRDVMGTNPSEFSGCGRRPVERVSWNDVQEFIGRLNARAGGNHYRLPTEAEWEYAARAETAGSRYAANLDAIAWYRGNSGGRTHPVGQKVPNAWGLHDMLGNVWELVQDWHGDYPGGAVTDPAGPDSGSHRVARGGSWSGSDACCRASDRSRPPPSFFFNFLGFRLVRVE